MRSKRKGTTFPAKQKAFAYNEKGKKKLHQCLHAVSKADMKIFFQNQIDITKRLLSTNHFTEELYNGRKALKHLLYNQQAVQQAWKEKPSLDFSYIDELQEALEVSMITLEYFNGEFDTKDMDILETKKKTLQDTVAQKANGFLRRINLVFFPA